ncbi:NUFIP1 domain-containing protein [Mycena venus]|uniref:NUFIP1 domain-containing protein n=1 Tax=Mycena venus TaxID=2733690 RepID=A0A8H6XTD5_9AGAR|nr:NUFIP1 domain-containing protein [Mycena venus]
MQQPPWPQQSYYSSHYAQAYMQQQAFPPVATTPLGYTISSTYNPAGPSNAPGQSASFSAPWYQAGNSRCTYKDCTFRGSAQTVETHMMDRHLIFPPGWEKRKKKPEWDADPSLKGKPIPIQGTTVILDSPEQVEAWIAERKKRWPSAPRVEEKKRKMEEAVARGQLSLEDSGLAGEETAAHGRRKREF